MDFLILISATVMISATLIFLYIKYKYYFVKPSIIFIVFFNVFLQWPAIYYYNFIENSLTTARFGFILMFSLSPLSVLLLSMFYTKSAKKVYQGLDVKVEFSLAFKLLLLFCVLLGPIIYFQYVSIYNTGLVSILRGDSYAENSIFREQSLKLLPAFPRYFHTLTTRSLSFLLVMILINEIPIQSSLFKKFWKIFKLSLLVLSVALFLAIDGSRAPGAQVFLCIGFFILYRGKINLRPVLNFKFISIVLIIISIPATLEYLRTDSKNLTDIMNIFVDRIFYIRLEAGILTIKYSEMYGNWGLAALGNFANLLGIKSINVANFVSSLEYSGPVESGLVNASFMMTYYAYFGILALPLSAALVLLLDVILWFVANKISINLFIFAVVGYTMAIFALVDADYTTIFITHGLLMTLAVLYILSKIMQPKEVI